MIFYSDFGLSRTYSEDVGEELTEYVVTRFYRAPEIMLSRNEYTHSVDIWSIGQLMSSFKIGDEITTKLLELGGKIRREYQTMIIHQVINEIENLQLTS